MAITDAQLSNPPPEFTISGRIVQGLVETVEAAGVPRSQFLRSAQVDPDELQRPNHRVLCSEVHRLCDRAMEVTRDPALGLHWAERLSADTFNPLSHMFAHSTTLRHAFQSLADCSRLLTDRASYELIETDDRVILRCTPPAAASARTRRFTAEMLLVSFLRVFRSFDRTAFPDYVSFDFAAPSDVREYARIFRSVQRFGQAHSEMAFDRALLDIESPNKDDDVHQALRAIAERRVLQLSDRLPYALRVRDYLVQHAPGARAEMSTVAKALGLSERSLRRRMDAEGRTFTTVVSEAKAILAKSLLRNTHMTIQEIGFELGFGDSSAFHRAFKRWSGSTPQVFRARAR